MLYAMRELCVALAVVLGFGQWVSGASPAIVPAASAQPDEYLVAGIVIAANPAASLLTIRQANLLGRLHIETKSYRVRQRRLLAGLRSGDRITAVFSVRDGMLHNLTVHARKPAHDN